MSYNLYNIVYYIFILYPKIAIILFLVLSIIFNIYLFYLQSSFYEQYIKFHDRNTVKVQRHLNPLNKNYIDVPLDYKVFDIKYTFFKVIFYIIGCIFPFLILRFLRLGTKIDLLSYFNHTNSLPLFITLIMICNAFHSILFFRVFWLNIYSMFYKELKRLFIYSIQFGGCLDVRKSHKNQQPYIFTYLLNPLKNITYQNLNLFLYDVIENLQNKIKINEGNELTLFMINFFKELKLSIPLFYKLGIYFIFFFFIITELYFNHFVLKKIYYILFFLFFYKQFYNLIYFSWHHNIEFDLTLALYYYKMNDLIPNTQHSHSLRIFYAVGATYEENERLLYYLNTGLNLPQADAFRNNEEWPKYPKFYKFFKNKLSTFIIWIKKNIYNKLLNKYIFIMYQLKVAFTKK